MKHKTPSYQRHRFPSEIMSYAVWLYHRFCLSFREVEELLAEQGITVTYETVRQWCQKFGPDYARKLKKRRGRLGDIWYIDDGYFQLNQHSNPSTQYACRESINLSVMVLCVSKVHFAHSVFS